MLTVEKLNLHYGKSQILHDVSLSAQTGAVTCVMGANGVGNASLLWAISGVHPRSGGKVALDGKNPGASPALQLARLGIRLRAAGTRYLSAHDRLREP
jgi:urea transport system ATP-binding protein